MQDQFQLKQSVVSAGQRRAWIFVLMVMFFNCLVLVGQQESGSVRDIKRKYSNFDQLRPKATSKNQFPAKKSKSFPKSVPKSLPTNLSASGQQMVGITLWKLRPQGMRDPKPEVPIAGMIAERLSPRLPISEGDRLRFTIEVARPGYLYVVTREKYTDGSFGIPYLIFPTQRIRNANNQVGPGVLIGIPALMDKPPYFEFYRSERGHIGEELTILLTPQPLQLSIGKDGQALSNGQFAEWQKWSSQPQIVDLPSKAGGRYTLVEQTAEDQVSARLLQRGDPLPQVLYCASSKTGPTMFTIPLPIQE